MNDSDIRILVGLARIAPDTTAESADWAEVLRRARAGRTERRVPAPLPTTLQPGPDGLGWGTRPIRATVTASGRPVAAESGFHGWGTRRF